MKQQRDSKGRFVSSQEKNYHFFIPYKDNNGCSIVHWSNTLENFRSACRNRDFVEDDPQCRILDPATLSAADIWLSQLLSWEEKEIAELL